MRAHYWHSNLFLSCPRRHAWHFWHSRLFQAFDIVFALGKGGGLGCLLVRDLDPGLFLAGIVHVRGLEQDVTGTHLLGCLILFLIVLIVLRNLLVRDLELVFILEFKLTET